MESLFVVTVFGVEFREGSFEPEGGEDSGGAVARSNDVDHIEVVLFS